MKLIQVTDTHIVPAGEQCAGLDPRARLDSVVDVINRNHADAELCIFSGDLTQKGSVEAFEELRECLAALELPYRLMIGNHDKRDNFQHVFPDAPADPNGFVQQSVETSEGVLLLLDSHDPDGHFGSYREKRLEWLAAQLELAGERPVYIFVHHPPFNIEIPRMDRMALLEAEPLAALLGKHPNIRHLFFGHIHRGLAGSWRGIPFSAIRGTNHGTRSDFDRVLETHSTHHPPALAVIFIEPERTVVHPREVEPGMGEMAG